MNETVKLIGATIVVIVCIAIVVYLMLRKPSEEYLAREREIKAREEEKAEKRRQDITTLHINDILWMGILAYGIATLIIVPLVLWTEMSVIIATILHISIMGILQIVFHFWHHNRRQAELALQSDTTFSIKFQLLSTQEMLQSVLWNLIGYTLVIGTFVFSTWALHEGLSQVRFNVTVNDWDSTEGFIAQNGNEFIYMYQVDNRDYVGVRQSFANKSLDKDEYTLWEDVVIFFDPAKPKLAVVDKETTSPIPILFISGLFYVFPITIIAAMIISTTRKVEADNNESPPEDSFAID